MQLPVRNSQGQQVDTIEVDERVFGMKPNLHVVHQVLVAQQANRRTGTAATKTRGEVRGSTRKIRSQKYTGRARQGGIRAPHHKGGGVVFGPHPRSYRQRVPKRMRRLAIRSALSAKVADGQLTVLDELSLDQPRTKKVTGVLQNLNLGGSVLMVTAEPDRNVLLSARNIPKVDILPAQHINVLALATHRDVVMTVAAVRQAESLWGGQRARLRRIPAGGGS
ncbi:MAG: 50S ribosomal protein L4 [Dehalococcoidia bacterium]